MIRFHPIQMPRFPLVVWDLAIAALAVSACGAPELPYDVAL